MNERSRSNGTATVFEERVQAWREWQLSPWGQLRYRLVAQLLERHLGVLASGTTRTGERRVGVVIDNTDLAPPIVVRTR